MWIKIAVQEVGPVTLVAFRVLFGMLFGLAVILAFRIPWPRTFTAWLPLLILGITNIAAPFFLISWGEQTIDSAVAAILDATVPLFTIVIAQTFLREDKMNLPKTIGLLVGFLGVIVLMSRSINASQSSLLGQAAVVLASIFYAGSAIYVRKTTENVHGILRSIGPLISANLLMWPAAFLIESPVQFPQLGITWISLLFLGILGSGFAFVLAFYLIHEIGPTRATMVTYLFPLGGVILGVLFLREPMTWQLITGGVLIVASLAVVNWQPAESNTRIGTEPSVHQTHPVVEE